MIERTHAKKKARPAPPTAPAVEPPATVGQCRICGCTYTQACLGGCDWANSSHTLCTACESPHPARAADVRKVALKIFSSDAEVNAAAKRLLAWAGQD